MLRASFCDRRARGSRPHQYFCDPHLWKQAVRTSRGPFCPMESADFLWKRVAGASDTGRQPRKRTDFTGRDGLRRSFRRRRRGQRRPRAPRGPFFIW